MKHILIFSCFIFLFSDSNAQKNEFHVPWLKTFKPEKLSIALTVNLSSDSDKVYAIHHWITHHIKYDVKKFRKFNYDHLSVKKILKRRKCTCVGYSDLFNELCLYAHLKSVFVPGYSKNDHVDLEDKFYLADHSWNAVLLNGKWELVDACWDAGYISNSKTSVVRKILSKISFDLIKKFKLKMHFVQAPVEVFYLKSGKFFSGTHLPINPIWQQLKSPISISQFENDSSYYLNRFDNSPDEIPFNQFNSKEQTIYQQSDALMKERLDGFASYNFNNRNCYEIANAWRLISEETYSEIDIESTDTLTQINFCDTAIAQLNNSIFFFSKNDSLLRIQCEELLLRNNTKAAIFKSVIDKFFSSTKRVSRAFTPCTRMHNSFRETANKKIKYNYHRVKLLKETIFHISILTKNSYSVRDSLRSDSLLKINSSLIKSRTIKLRDYYSYLDSLHLAFISEIKKNNFSRSTLLNQEAEINFYRTEFCDDFDFEIIKSRDSILLNKLRNDSLLFISDTSINKYFYTKLKNEKTLVSSLITAYRERLSLLRTRALCCFSFNPISKDFFSSIDSMILIFEEDAVSQKLFKTYSIDILKESKGILNLTENENTLYKIEKKTESDNSNARKVYFNSRLKSLKSISNKELSNALILKNKTKQLRRHFSSGEVLN